MGFFKVNFKETISRELMEGAYTNTSKGSPIFRKCVIDIKKLDLSIGILIEWSLLWLNEWHW